MAWLIVCALWGSVAGATEYFLEGPSLSDRGVAVSASRAARDAGHEARVVRVYDEASGGWRYVVRVEGLKDEATAMARAAEVAPLIGGDPTLYAQETPEAEPVRIGGAAGGGARVDAPASPLEPTIAAHGGRTGGAARLASASTVSFRFRRTLPAGAVVDHRWARSGSSLSLEVIPVSGGATASRTLVTDAGAWLAVGQGGQVPQDRERTLETLAALAPDQVVPFVLAFGALADERRELGSLHEQAEPGEVEGAPTRSLRWDGDQASGTLQLEVDAATHLIRRVTFDDGAMVVQFDGWGPPVGDVRLPASVRTWRDGQLVDTVEILELTVDAELPKEWFAAP